MSGNLHHMNTHYTATELNYPRCGAKLGRATHTNAPVTQDKALVTCAKCRKLMDKQK